MHKTLEELYIEEVLNEGLFDRMGARAAGVGGAIKGLGNTIAGNYKAAKAGIDKDVAGMQAAHQQIDQGGVKAGYNQAKLKSITNTFQNEMKALFGNDWATTYPDLASALQKTATTSPAPAQQTSQQQTGQPANTPAQQTPPALPQQTGQQTQPPAQQNNQQTTPPVQQKPQDRRLNKMQLNKINKRITNEPRVRRSISKLLNQPEGQPIKPNQNFDYKQKMAIKRLLGEGSENFFGDTYDRFLAVPKL